MNSGSDPAEVPLSQAPLDWIPEQGVRTCRSGLHFDAVRIAGERGADTAAALRAATDGGSGPILMQAVDPQVTYFLVPPAPNTTFRWPPGIRELRSTEYVSIPAYEADDASMRWLSYPTPTACYVSRYLLRDLLCRTTGWAPATEGA